MKSDKTQHALQILSCAFVTQEYAICLSAAAMHTRMQRFEQMIGIIKEQVIDECDAKQEGLLRKLTWQQAQAVSVIAAMSAASATLFLSTSQSSMTHCLITSPINANSYIP